MAEPGGAEPEPEPEKGGKGQPAEEAGGDVGAGSDKIVGKVGDATDYVLEAMCDGLENLEDNLDEKGCCARCIKRIREFEDPVRMARCTISRILFLAGSVLAFTLGIIGASGDEPDWWEFICGIVAGLLAGFAGVYLGGDIFMVEDFRRIVNQIQKQVNAFRESNTKMEVDLKNLSHVRKGLDEVYAKMNGDLDATTALLKDMERYGSLQTATAVASQFFASDYNQNGHIEGQEAGLLCQQFVLLWQLVPSFRRERFEVHVEKHGLTLAQLASLLDAIVQEDQGSCLAKLEELCGEDDGANPARGAEDVEAAAGGEPVFAEDVEHEAMPPEGGWLDIEMGIVARPPRRLRPCVFHAAGPPERKEAWADKSASTISRAGTSKSGSSDKDEKDKDLGIEPLCSVNICTVGPLSGGEFSIWGYYHLALLLCVPISVALLIQALVDDGMSDIIHFILAASAVGLASVLSAAGGLIEMLRALRRQVKKLKEESDRFEVNQKDLKKKVDKLQFLRIGFEKLQSLCEGNVDKARELIRKSNTKIKAQAMALVTIIFRFADEDKDLNLNEKEMQCFFESLDLVFRSVHGFKIEEVRGEMNNEMTHSDIKTIVDFITAFKDAEGAEKEDAEEAGAVEAAVEEAVEEKVVEEDAGGE